ncbi:MAG: hypothetical protein ACI4GB_00475 [Acutalibacteraceae bacterium]
MRYWHTQISHRNGKIWKRTAEAVQSKKGGAVYQHEKVFIINPSSSNPKLSEFNQSDTENNITVTQFHASRPDMQTRRYIVGDGYQWLSPNNANGLDYAIYTTSTSIKQTAPIGERVVFSAEF